MKLYPIMITAAALALAACDSGSRTEANDVDAAGNAVGNVADPAATAAAGATASSGQQYVELAASSDLYEIESARIALEKTQNADVRALAQMILDDHQRSTRELTAAARQAEPPIRLAPQMTPAQQADVEALRAAAADALDQAYLDQQVRAHEQAMRLVTDYAANGDVPSLRQHAATVAGPILQHLSRARELSEQATAPVPE